MKKSAERLERDIALVPEREIMLNRLIYLKGVMLESERVKEVLEIYKAFLNIDNPSRALCHFFRDINNFGNFKRKRG